MAVVAVAVGIALLPVLTPALPGNAAPVDFVLVLSIVVVLLWASSRRKRLHFPYAIPMAVLLWAGTVAGMLGRYPERSVLALGQASEKGEVHMIEVLMRHCDPIVSRHRIGIQIMVAWKLVPGGLKGAAR